jgi:hypothetical protein
MPKADPKRISWYLSLQRILHFQGYSIAPRSISLQGHSLVAPDVYTTDAGAMSSQSEPISSYRSSSLQTLLLPLDRQTSPTDSSGLASAPRVTTAAASTSTSRFSRWRKVPISVQVSKLAEILQKHTGPKTAGGPKYSAPLKSNRRTIKSDGLGFSSNKPIPIAPINMFSPEQRLTDSEPFPNPTSIASRITDVAFGHFAIPPIEKPMLDQGFEGQYQLPPSGRDVSIDRGQPQRNKPVVSMLHIDGSALGRWAVQHLERALGKPATGMTGVDPRATIPRSRVAPF